MAAEPEPSRFAFIAGRLCLDFANTADWHASDQPVEFLETCADLITWSQAAGVLDDTGATRLRALADAYPTEAARVHGRALELREALYRAFSARAAGRQPLPGDLSTINVAIASAGSHARVEPDDDGFSWGWDDGDEPLARMLWPVARSAGELLTSDDLRRVRKCAGDPCGWLFVDTSRNHSRRWCTMESCGNRAKARRHYERARQAQLSDSGN